MVNKLLLTSEGLFAVGLANACSTRFFYKKKVYKKMILKSSKFKKILRRSRGSISNIKLFYWPKIYISSLLHSKR